MGPGFDSLDSFSMKKQFDVKTTLKEKLPSIPLLRYSFSLLGISHNLLLCKYDDHYMCLKPRPYLIYIYLLM